MGIKVVLPSRIPSAWVARLAFWMPSPRYGLYNFVNIKGEHLGTFSLLLVCRAIFNFCSLLIFSVPVNRKVPDWLPLRLVSLIYPKNRNNTGGDRTGHVWVQDTLAWPTLGEYCPDIKRELFLGMQAICFGGEQTKPFAITRHYNVFASSKPQTSILSLGKNCSVFLPSSSTCQHSLRSNSIACFLGNSPDSLLGCDFPCIFL